MRFSVEIFCVF